MVKLYEMAHRVVEERATSSANQAESIGEEGGNMGTTTARKARPRGRDPSYQC